METHSIVFQAFPAGADSSSWENSEIVYALHLLEPGHDFTNVLDAISAVLGCTTIRYTTFHPGEEISQALALRKSGGYYQSYFTQSYK